VRSHAKGGTAVESTLCCTKLIAFSKKRLGYFQQIFLKKLCLKLCHKYTTNGPTATVNTEQPAPTDPRAPTSDGAKSFALILARTVLLEVLAEKLS
jgi:hypothetical protein